MELPGVLTFRGIGDVAAIDDLAQKHDIEWLWVRGHSGHDGNERADELANRGVETVKGEA